MPHIVAYPDVERVLTGQGLVCVYPNSGAFAFPSDAATHVLAWVGPDDPTIRPAARPFVRQVDPPYVTELAGRLVRGWREAFGGGDAWLMPKSHWAYELEFGSDAWMPDALAAIGVDPAPLRSMNSGAAIAFKPDEAVALRSFAEQLLTRLDGSDFLLALPGHPVVCTVHHHQQLWWVTTDERAWEALTTISR